MKKIIIIFALIAFLTLIYPSSAIAFECTYCHQLDWGKYPLINNSTSVFGVHVNANSTDGDGNLTSLDCIACHYSVNTTTMHDTPVSTYPILTRTCEYCHINNSIGTVPANRICLLYTSP